jgi:hypothetical protein
MDFAHARQRSGFFQLVSDGPPEHQSLFVLTESKLKRVRLPFGAELFRLSDEALGGDAFVIVARRSP